MLKNIFVLLFAIVAEQGIAQISRYQVEATMNRIDFSCKVCCDSGTNVAYCEDIRNIKLDSVLNVVYNELKKELDSANFRKLKREQKNWLKKRNANNANNAAKADKNEERDRALVVSEDSYFIEQRLAYLSKKLK